MALAHFICLTTRETKRTLHTGIIFVLNHWFSSKNSHTLKCFTLLFLLFLWLCHKLISSQKFYGMQDFIVLRLIGNLKTFPVDIYLLKVNNRNIRTRYEIFSKLTIKTQERRQWRLSGVFIVNFEHISHLVLVFLLLTWNM